MVKIPKGPPHPIDPRPPVDPPPPCPTVEVYVSLVDGARVSIGDRAVAQAREERARVVVSGQVVAWIDDSALVEQIRRCSSNGRTYAGSVLRVEGDSALISLGGGD